MKNSIRSKNIVNISFSLILILLLSSCNKKQDELNTETIREKPILNGLYNATQNYDGSIYKQIWIFSDNMLYTLEKSISGQYSDESLGLTYSYSHFYLQQSKMFICGPKRNNSLLPLQECKLKKYNPAYEIVKVDTLTYSAYDSKQIVHLKVLDYNSEITLEKTVLDTIKREVNVKADIFEYLEK